jgi:hypothetical protein
VTPPRLKPGSGLVEIFLNELLTPGEHEAGGENHQQERQHGQPHRHGALFTREAIHGLARGADRCQVMGFFSLRVAWRQF